MKRLEKISYAEYWESPIGKKVQEFPIRFEDKRSEIQFDEDGVWFKDKVLGKEVYFDKGLDFLLLYKAVKFMKKNKESFYN